MSNQASHVQGTTEHMARVTERWLKLQTTLPAKNQELGRKSRQVEMRLIHQAARSSSTTKKLIWLRRAADELQRSVLPQSACRHGCSHCCHISTVVTRAEAQVIARETGAKLESEGGRFAMDRNPDHDAVRQQLHEEFFGKACTFLVNGRCSIYQHRPLACRLAISLDEDDLLCQLVPGQAIDVPYLDVLDHQLYTIQILGTTQAYDDIRAWFPDGVAER